MLMDGPVLTFSVCVCMCACVLMISYLHLLSAKLFLCHAVSFGQHRYYVDLFVQGLHVLHI